MLGRTVTGNERLASDVRLPGPVVVVAIPLRVSNDFEHDELDHAVGGRVDLQGMELQTTLGISPAAKDKADRKRSGDFHDVERHVVLSCRSWRITLRLSK